VGDKAITASRAAYPKPTIRIECILESGEIGQVNIGVTVDIERLETGLGWSPRVGPAA
jgi:hypothetical protein